MRGHNPRAGGILLHPSSLPSVHGIGDLGEGVHGWLKWLQLAGCRIWQILPLGPTGLGDSPYQSPSSYAGNPMLIDPTALATAGLIQTEELSPPEPFPADRVDYSAVLQFKTGLFRRAVERFADGYGAHIRDAFERFCTAERDWLDDFSLFMALKQAMGGAPWTAWDVDLRLRERDALTRAKTRLAAEIQDQKLRQFFFFEQWSQVKRAAGTLGIEIIGDLPIFVAHDSADVWSNQDLFYLEQSGNPAFVAGVPPDYFSPTGQRWGNPLYCWDRMREDGYLWWRQRIGALLKLVDTVRLDHFRGFEAYWEIPADEPTAENGRWVEGPGADFLTAMRTAFGNLPIVAEDLGVITEAVEALRDRFGFPGMKVLQFAFEDGPQSAFLPHHFVRHCVAYTGTHDNDTSRGWFESASDTAQQFCLSYLGSEAEAVVWDMLRCVWASVADRAVAPLQDCLQLGSGARMNYPGQVEGNWIWRCLEEHLSQDLADALRMLNTLYDRLGAEETLGTAQGSVEGRGSSIDSPEVMP